MCPTFSQTQRQHPEERRTHARVEATAELPRVLRVLSLLIPNHRPPPLLLLFVVYLFCFLLLNIHEACRIMFYIYLESLTYLYGLNYHTEVVASYLCTQYWLCKSWGPVQNKNEGPLVKSYLEFQDGSRASGLEQVPVCLHRLHTREATLPVPVGMGPHSLTAHVPA